VILQGKDLEFAAGDTITFRGKLTNRARDTLDWTGYGARAELWTRPANDQPPALITSAPGIMTTTGNLAVDIPTTTSSTWKVATLALILTDPSLRDRTFYRTKIKLTRRNA
jgi:hypothetical protein